MTEKDQPSTASWANACAWNRRPLGQVPSFPGEQGAVSLVAASHIYIMAAAHRKGSGLGREPFMKATGIRVLTALASPEVPPAHP